jgi:hypothetical protein
MVQCWVDSKVLMLDPLMVQRMGLLKGQRTVDEMVEMKGHRMVLLWVRQMGQSLVV